MFSSFFVIIWEAVRIYTTGRQAKQRIEVLPRIEDFIKEKVIFVELVDFLK